MKISISAVCTCGNVIAGGKKAVRGPLVGKLANSRYLEGSNYIEFVDGPYGLRPFEILLNPCCPGKQILLSVKPRIDEVQAGAEIPPPPETNPLQTDERQCINCKRFASDRVVLADRFYPNSYIFTCVDRNECQQYQREFR